MYCTRIVRGDEHIKLSLEDQRLWKQTFSSPISSILIFELHFYAVLERSLKIRPGCKIITAKNRKDLFADGLLFNIKRELSHLYSRQEQAEQNK